ncbi:MAG: hypothetical protein LBQ31_07785, partial [Bacteroidales bacterium]|nr:hypothetical protein [Bacteroidales bacterium]
KGQLDFWIKIWSVKILMNFRDLKVNTDKQILWVSGESVNDPSLLIDVDAITEDINTIADALTPKDTIVVDFTISDSIAPTIDCSADTVCTVTVFGDNGEDKKIEISKDSTGNIANAPIVIADNEGNSVVIDEHGNVTTQKKENEVEKGAGTSDSNAFEGNYIVYVGDSTITKNKTFINTKKENKLSLKYEPTKEDTSTTVSTKIIYKPEWSDKNLFYPKTENQWKQIDVNKKVSFPLDSLSKGQYAVLIKDRNNNIDTFLFKIENKFLDFACTVCGKDLSLTLTKLRQIFPNNTDLTQEHVNLFNEALEKGEFNTCSRHAHFFSQVKHESGNFKKFKEDLSYRLQVVLNTWPASTNSKMFFNQNFWDNKDYLQYFWLNVYELVDASKNEKGQYDAKTIKTFKWGSSSAIAKDTIRFPISYNTKNDGAYKKNSYTETEKNQKNEKLFSQIYQNINGNGNEASKDGYKFVGRGAIQLTGRSNYKNVCNKCNSTFGTSFYWETNPDEVATNNKAKIFSAVAFFLLRFNNNLQLLDTDNVEFITKKVNGGTNGLDERQQYYDEYRSSLYNCNP